MKAWLSAALLCLCSLSAQAGEVIAAVTPAALKAHLQDRGYQVFAHEDENDQPQLLVTPTDDPNMVGVDERRGFAMRMFGCQPKEAAFYDRACTAYVFHAYLTPGFPIADKVYADWNRDFGRSRAFVKEGHPRLEWYVTLEGGVTWAHIDQTVELWRAELSAFLDHLDASLLD